MSIDINQQMIDDMFQIFDGQHYIRPESETIEMLQELFSKNRICQYPEEMPVDWTHFHGVFNEITGESESASIYYLHDNEEGKRVGFRRTHGEDNVEILYFDPYDHDNIKVPKVLGTITLNESLHVVKFIEQYRPKKDPATIEEELILLRKMAALIAELNAWMNRPKLPDGTINKWRKEGYISSVVPGHTIPHAMQYLSLEYKNRFQSIKS